MASDYHKTTMQDHAEAQMRQIRSDESAQLSRAKLREAEMIRRFEQAHREAMREEEQRQAILSMATSFDRIATALEALAGKGADNGRD